MVWSLVLTRGPGEGLRTGMGCRVVLVQGLVLALQMLAQGLQTLEGCFSRLLIAHQQAVGVADQLASNGNVDGRLLLVSCDDPHLQWQSFLRNPCALC